MSPHHHHRPATDHGGTPPSHRPYWKRAHTDWRLWVAVVLMFLAMIVYLATGDLARRLVDNAHNRRRPCQENSR